jgi:hypothetical protein
MPGSSPNKVATRKSWKILPLPNARADLGFTESYTADEFERIKCGLIPKAMEDKWFAFFEEPWLYFHRGWTGACIYAVRFEPSSMGASAIESWVSRDSAQYQGTQTDYDRVMLKFLIDAFLLGKPAAFPVPGNVPLDAPREIYQHHVVGRAYPETTFPAGPPPNPTWSSRIRRLLWKRRSFYVA